MAVLEQLRSKGALLSTVIGIALLSFVVGDFFTGNRSIFSSDDIGEIGGKGISYTEYNGMVDYYTGIYTAMGRATQTEATDEIREQAWFALVQQYAVEPEYAHLGLEVSKDELFDLVQGRHPSQLAMQYFSDPNTGNFDRARVLQYLQELEANPNPDAKTTWLYVEKEIINQRIQSKMLALVGKSLYATSAEAQASLQNNASTADIEYVVRNFSDAGDSGIKVSNRDIKKYYKRNKKRYEQTESCDIEYITIDIAPSPEDNAAVKEWIEALAPQFAAAQDAYAFAAQHSDVAADEVYRKQSELQGAMAAFAFEKTAADLLHPFEEGGIYKMARIASIRYLPDSVKARHILVRARSSMDETRTLADSIKKALQRGASFSDLSDKYSIDQAASQKGGDLGWFGQQAMVKPFGDSCFFAPKGKFMIVETNYGIHVVQVTDRGREEKRVQLAVIQREVLPSKTTRTQLFGQMNDIAVKAVARQEFLDAAAEKNLIPRTASRITINDKDVHSLRNARELVRWAWKAKEGKVSPVFEIDDRFVLAALVIHRKDGFTPIKQVRDEISALLLQEKKGEALLNEVQGLDVASAAGRYSLTPLSAAGINFASFYIAGVGVEPKLAGAVSATPMGQTAAVAGSAGVYVYRVTDARQNAPDAPAIAEERRRLQRTAAQRAGYEALNLLRTSAKIKDKRGETLF